MKINRFGRAEILYRMLDRRTWDERRGDLSNFVIDIACVKNAAPSTPDLWITSVQVAQALGQSKNVDCKGIGEVL